jgi:preprotein translocase subunit SecA
MTLYFSGVLPPPSPSTRKPPASNPSETVGESRVREIERLIILTKIDDAWSDYLVAVTDLRGGIHWVSLSGKQPLHEFLVTATSMFREVGLRIEQDVVDVLRNLRISDHIEIESAFHRGATWTYLVNDQPFADGKAAWAKALLHALQRITASKAAGEVISGQSLHLSQ